MHTFTKALEKLPYWVLALIPTILLCVIFYKIGIRLTPDSEHYLFAAWSFATQGRLLMSDCSPLTLFAPGFPVSLSLFERFDLSATHAYTFVSPFLLLMTLLFWRQTIKATIEDRFFREICFATLCLSVPLFFVHVILCSESLFNLLIAIAFFGLVKSKNEHNKSATVLLASIAFALGCFVRYPGIVFCYSAALVLLLSSAYSKRIKSVFLLVFPSTAITGIVLLRNYRLSGFLTGDRPPPFYGPFIPFIDIVEVVMGWLFPVQGYPTLALCFFVLLFVTTVLAHFFTKRNTCTFSVPFLCYFLFVWYIASKTGVEHDERIFSSAFPLFLIFVYSLISEYQSEKEKLFFRLIAVLILGYHTILLSRNWLLWMEGYNPII